MNQGTLKKLVNDKQLWEAYLEYIDNKINAAHVRMEQSPNVEALYRMQGEIAILRRLKLMREEINGYNS
jgi:hypothetical protein